MACYVPGTYWRKAILRLFGAKVGAEKAAKLSEEIEIVVLNFFVSNSL